MVAEARVLVVDDEPAIRALVAKIVDRAGFPVDSAADGAEAIEMMAGREYCVLVIDLMMPNVDGFGLIEHVRKQRGRKPAIIVISAGDSSTFRQLDGAMVHSIVRKPFDINVLGDLITAAARTMAQELGGQKKNEGGDVLPFSSKQNVC
jgi:DNA-binding response OmpR family regulator